MIGPGADDTTYRNLLHTAARAGDTLRAVKVIDEMKSMGYKVILALTLHSSLFTFHPHFSPFTLYPSPFTLHLPFTHPSPFIPFTPSTLAHPSPPPPSAGPCLLQYAVEFVCSGATADARRRYPAARAETEVAQASQPRRESY